MTDATVAPIEPAATWEQLEAATGWKRQTIQAAIRQGNFPGVALRIGDSTQFVYAVPLPALRLWQQNPTLFAPRPVSMIRKFNKTA